MENKLQFNINNVYLQKVVNNKNELTLEDIIEFLEKQHGNYLAKVIIREWMMLNDFKSFKVWEEEYGRALGLLLENEYKRTEFEQAINKLEEEHGKSLGLLFVNEDQRQKLSELNKKLENAADIYKKDIKMAAAVQQSLLFKEPPKTINYDIAFLYQPIASVSGDFYDFYVNQSNYLEALVIADVSGHGIASSLLTAIAKPIFYRVMHKNSAEPLNKVMRLIHDEIVKDFEESGNYLTTIILRFKENKVEYVNAAHPEIIIKKSKTGECIFVRKNEKVICGPMIGLKSIVYDYESVDIEVDHDDIVVLYTDCLSESFNGNKEEFGQERIIKTLKDATDNDPKKILNALFDSLKTHIGNTPLNDDLTIIVLKKT